MFKQKVKYLLIVFLLSLFAGISNVNAEWKIATFEVMKTTNGIEQDYTKWEYIYLDVKTDRVVMSNHNDIYYINKKSNQLISEEEYNKNIEGESWQDYGMGNSYYLNDNFTKGDYAYNYFEYGCGSAGESEEEKPVKPTPKYKFEGSTVYRADGSVFLTSIKAASETGDFLFTLDDNNMNVYKNGSLIVSDKAAKYNKDTFAIGSYFISKNGKYYGFHSGGDEDVCEWDWALLLVHEEEPKESYLYNFIEGANKIFDLSKIKNMIFKIDADFKLFKELYIDNTLISKDKYEITEGSTIITLKEDISKLYADGKDHTIKAVYNNGKEVSTNFKVLEISTEKVPNQETNKVPEETLKEEVKSCQKVGDKFYDKVGREVSKLDYEKSCLPPNPDSGYTVPFIIGLVIIGGIIIVKKKPLKKI